MEYRITDCESGEKRNRIQDYILKTTCGKDILIDCGKMMRNVNLAPHICKMLEDYHPNGFIVDFIDGTLLINSKIFAIRSGPGMFKLVTNWKECFK